MDDSSPIEFIISEGRAGMWHYHISRRDEFTQSLCGELTMITSISLEDWGSKSEHIPESYCEKCKSLYDKLISED